MQHGIDTGLLAERHTDDILEGIAEAFFALDRDWRVVYFNRACEDFFGLPRDGVLGHVVWDLFPQTIGTGFHRHYHRAMAERQPVEFEIESAVRPGHWLAVRAFPIRQGLGVAFRDISERQQAEAELRYQLDLSRSITDNTAEALFLMDDEGRVTFMNPAAERMFGFTHDEMVGQVLHDLIHHHRPDGRRYPIHDCPLASVFRGGGGLRFHEDLFFHKSGRPVSISCSNMPIFKEGRIVGAALVVQDITERKDREAALRESEEHLRNTVELNPQTAWTADPEGRITSYASRWLAMTGQAPGEPLGDGWQKALHPDDVPGTLASFGSSLASGEPVDVEYRIRHRPTGEDRWMRARAQPLRNAAGEIVRWYGAVEDIHDRKTAELMLRESERRLAAVLQHAPVGIILAEAPTGRLLYGNDEVDRIWKAPFRASVGIGDYDHYEGYHIETGRRYAAEEWPLARAILHGEVVLREEIAFRRQDGTTGVMSANATPIRDETGAITAGVVTFEDVTERRANEEALRRLNETLETEVAQRTQERDRIWRLARDLMCVARPDGTLISVNPAWERLLGWPLDWLAGRNAAEIKHPDDAERTAAELERLAAGYPSHGFEDRYRHRDGSWRWISWTIEPEGSLIYCVGRDVTEERDRQRQLEAAESARRDADALYRAYFENTPEALFVIGVEPDGGFVVEELNPAHEAGVGFKLSEVRGKRIESILPPPAARRVIETYRHVVDTGELYQYREVFDLDGAPQHWDTSLVPVLDAQGRITRLMGSSRNVTRQVQAEEALRQAQKMEAVGQLTGGIAHDFNNLLGAVVGSLDLIRRKPGDVERVKRFAEAGLQAAERGAKLTGQLLAFSRAQRIELKPVGVANLVEGMRDLVARSLGPAIRLTLALDGDGAVLSDPTQLEMAVLNLAINARDAMPGGGDLVIATRPHHVADDPELAPGEYVELSVRDTGTGMSPEVMSRAFDPFFTTKGVGKGTGLGLSQVFGIVRQAGGTVRISSRPGAGTTVFVYLPAVPAAAEAESVALEAGATAGAGHGTVLVVDDDPDMRRILVASLDALGYDVIEAEDGPAGLAALDKARPDVLLVDFAMPGMNGAEVVQAARQRHPGLPIIFASGYADTAAIEAVAGAEVSIIRKPFRVEELQAVLAETQGSHAGRAP